MRLRLKLKAKNSNVLSPNYYYPFSAVIYKLLNFGSPRFASYLHDIGFNLKGKSYKLFTFGLQLEKFMFHERKLVLLSENVHLYISTPLADDFLKNLVIGSFRDQQFYLLSDGIRTEFIIDQIERLPEPEYSQKMTFTMLSPLVLSNYGIHNNKMVQHYLRYNEDINEINRVLNANLANKYRLLYNKNYKGEKVKLTWDINYISKLEQKGKSPSRMIKVKKPDQQPINIYAINSPFQIEGDPNLIKVGYECGFGEKNSIGFGMVKYS